MEAHVFGAVNLINANYSANVDTLNTLDASVSDPVQVPVVCCSLLCLRRKVRRVFKKVRRIDDGAAKKCACYGRWQPKTS